MLLSAVTLPSRMAPGGEINLGMRACGGNARPVDSAFPNGKRYGPQKKTGGMEHPAGKRTGVQGGL
jgi:hypothetical protein